MMMEMMKMKSTQKSVCLRLCRKKRPKAKNGASRDEAGVWIPVGDGKKVWRKMGPWGSVEADDNFTAFCARFYATKATHLATDVSPAAIAREALVSFAIEEANRLPGEASSTSVALIFNRFLEMRQTRLAPEAVSAYKKMMALVIEIFPDLTVEKLNARVFRAIQAHIALYCEKKALTFAYCRKLVSCFKSVLRWGMGRDLVSPELMLKLQAVEPVGMGDEEYQLRESHPREAVPDDVILATLPHLPPLLADVVRILRGACMRPSELCRLRVQDLMELKESVAEIREHKTMRHHVRRYAAFTSEELAILWKWAEGKGPDEYIFSPRDTVRTCRKWDRKDDRQETKLAKAYSEKYTSRALGRLLSKSIRRAQKKGVQIPSWTLYQLRHSAVTANAIALGREAAQYVAGHKSPTTTEIYDHSARHWAAEAARVREGNPLK